MFAALHAGHDKCVRMADSPLFVRWRNLSGAKVVLREDGHEHELVGRTGKVNLAEAMFYRVFTFVSTHASHFKLVSPWRSPFETQDFLIERTHLIKFSTF